MTREDTLNAPQRIPKTGEENKECQLNLRVQEEMKGCFGRDPDRDRDPNTLTGTRTSGEKGGKDKIKNFKSKKFEEENKSIIRS